MTEYDRPMRVAVLLMAMVCACTDAAPCTNCPPIAGTYSLTWQPGESADSGCSLEPAPARLTLTQFGSALNATIDAQPLAGTLFDTYDFTLAGGFDPAYSLRGRVIVGHADAGAELMGTLRTSTLIGLDGRAGCEVNASYQAQQLSRTSP